MFGVWCLLLFSWIVGVVVYVVRYLFVLRIVVGCIIGLICLWVVVCYCLLRVGVLF